MEEGRKGWKERKAEKMLRGEIKILIEENKIWSTN